MKLKKIVLELSEVDILELQNILTTRRTQVLETYKGGYSENEVHSLNRIWNRFNEQMKIVLGRVPKG